MFITALLMIAPDWDQTKYLFTCELINLNNKILVNNTKNYKNMPQYG